VIPGLGRALDAIGAKHQAEPDFDAREWNFDDDDGEAEREGDFFHEAGFDEEF